MFIVLEGGEGAGKSTQIERLAQRFRSAGREVVVTFEPGATSLGAEIRKLTHHFAGPLDARAEALLMAADRAQHVAEVVQPALDREAIVVSDRYVPSSLVYQGVARELGTDAIRAMNDWATVGLIPDCVIVLDVDADTAARRVPEATDRLEAAGAAFHDAVRAAYRDLAAQHGWVVVDGTAAPDVVAAAVWSAVIAVAPSLA
jgi:dTMP kinase